VVEFLELPAPLVRGSGPEAFAALDTYLHGEPGLKQAQRAFERRAGYA
jgi:hypothetical protein